MAELTPISDRDLVRAAREGRTEAFDELARRYLPLVYRFLLRLTGDGHTAEDLSQETFLKVWKALGRFDVDKSFRTWIYAIARNVAVDHLRKKRPVSFTTVETEEGSFNPADDLADERPLAPELLERKEAAEELMAAVNKLPEKARSVVVLHDLEDLTFQEISDALKEPLNTVKSRYRRALATIRKLFEASIPKKDPL